MDPQFHQVANWMTERGRIVRYQPVSGIPSTERFTQAERLVEALWSLSSHLGINLGRKPTIVLTGEGVSVSSVLLSQLTQLEVEVLATYHMCGLCMARVRGIYSLTHAKPAETVNFRTIVDEVYIEEDPVIQD